MKEKEERHESRERVASEGEKGWERGGKGDAI